MITLDDLFVGMIVLCLAIVIVVGPALAKSNRS
jgi:hypothetical protein